MLLQRRTRNGRMLPAITPQMGVSKRECAGKKRLAATPNARTRIEEGGPRSVLAGSFRKGSRLVKEELGRECLA